MTTHNHSGNVEEIENFTDLQVDVDGKVLNFKVFTCDSGTTTIFPDYNFFIVNCSAVKTPLNYGLYISLRIRGDPVIPRCIYVCYLCLRSLELVYLSKHEKECIMCKYEITVDRFSKSPAEYFLTTGGCIIGCMPTVARVSYSEKVWERNFVDIPAYTKLFFTEVLDEKMCVAAVGAHFDIIIIFFDRMSGVNSGLSVRLRNYNFEWATPINESMIVAHTTTGGSFLISISKPHAITPLNVNMDSFIPCGRASFCERLGTSHTVSWLNTNFEIKTESIPKSCFFKRMRSTKSGGLAEGGYKIFHYEPGMKVCSYDGVIEIFEHYMTDTKPSI